MKKDIHRKVSKQEVDLATDKLEEDILRQRAIESREELEAEGALEQLNNPLGVEKENLPEGGYKLSRSERKSRLKFFKKLLTENETERLAMLEEDSGVEEDETPEKLHNRQARLQSWFVRRVNLERKIAQCSNPDHLYGTSS